MGGMELVEFLRARLDEDEAGAHRAAKAAGYNWEQLGSQLRDGAKSIDDHQRRHDPPRVLADVESKRRIIAAHEVNCTGHHEWPIDPATVAPDRGDRAGVDVALWHSLRLLALPYAGHPAWREEWRV